MNGSCRPTASGQGARARRKAAVDGVRKPQQCRDNSSPGAGKRRGSSPLGFAWICACRSLGGSARLACRPPGG
eukprot:6201698-Alexandrium_andersonii.AAC.1